MWAFVFTEHFEKKFSDKRTRAGDSEMMSYLSMFVINVVPDAKFVS